MVSRQFCVVDRRQAADPLTSRISKAAHTLIVCRPIAIHCVVSQVMRSKHTDPRIAFGQAVRKLRRQKGISQEKLAELADIHRTYIGDVERGTRNIALLNMTRIAKALGLSLSDLIREMENQ